MTTRRTLAVGATGLVVIGAVGCSASQGSQAAPGVGVCATWSSVVDPGGTYNGNSMHDSMQWAADGGVIELDDVAMDLQTLRTGYAHVTKGQLTKFGRDVVTAKAHPMPASTDPHRNYIDFLAAAQDAVQAALAGDKAAAMDHVTAAIAATDKLDAEMKACDPGDPAGGLWGDVGSPFHQ